MTGSERNEAANDAQSADARTSEQRLIDDCVHCGFCLPACPTYQSWGVEMDSPRGRIELMRGLADGKLSLNETVVRHFDRCLGCMGCVTACPSGVKYDVLIEATRARIEREHTRSAADSLRRNVLFALLPYPGRLRWLLLFAWLYALSGLQRALRRLGFFRRFPALAELDALAPRMSFHSLTARLPSHVAALGARRARVALVAGCVQRACFPAVNRATLNVLAKEGCEVVVPKAQGCCGALSIHAGRESEALDFARALIERIEAAGPLDAIVVNAAGCGSNLKDYARLFADDPLWSARARAFSAKVRDITEFLAALPAVAERHPIAARVAYHDACHLAHAQQVRAAPRALLRSIPGLELLEIPEGDQCCGSAGVYNLLESESARLIGARKAERVLSTRPDLVSSANPGCLLQIGKMLRARGAALPWAHPIQILDASLAGRDISDLEQER